MPRKYRDRRTARFAAGEFVKAFSGFERQAELALRALLEASTLNDLRVTPGHRLEALHGDRMGQWSIRINSQYRLCFEWQDGEAVNIEIVDYH